MTGAAFPAVGRSVTYFPFVDRIGRYESTAAPSSAVQSLEVAFDGMRVTKLTAGGLAPAETTWDYGANLRLTSSRLVSGADDVTLAYTRDADGLPTAVGPFTHERNGPDHSLSAITDGTGRTEEDVDDVADLDTRRLTVGGAEKYRLELTTDATGRVTGRREVDPEGGDQPTPTRTSAGRADRGAPRRDAGRELRLQRRRDRTTQGATYDAAGRLTGRNGISYTFDDDGFLVTRGGDSFTYARSGELRSATVGRTPVSYAYDGMGRMVARVQGGETTGYVYGDPDAPYRVSAARAPDGTLDRYLYGPRGNLYAILRGGARFHVGTDQIGSPRIVAAADGTIVKRLEYSAYGVTTDHDPGFFLPFGYAGGLRDPVTALVRFGLRDYEPQSGRSPRATPPCSKGPRGRSTAMRTTRPSPTTTPAAPPRSRSAATSGPAAARPSTSTRARSSTSTSRSSPGSASKPASAWVEAPRPTSSSRRPRRRASTRSRSSTAWSPAPRASSARSST